MKRLFIASVTFYLLTSCVATHIGTLSSSSIGKTVKYEDMACGVSQTNRYFGIGGLSQDALVLEAKRKLIKNRSLMPNEEYANFTIDFKRTYWPFYTQTKVTLSADVVRFTNDTINDPYSEKYKNKLLGGNLSNDLFTIGDSIIDKKLDDGTIISIESNDIVRILYKTEKDKIRTKKISIKDIYSKSKPYKGYQVGGMFIYSTKAYSANDYQTSGRIIALGLNSLVISDYAKKIQILKYPK